MLCIFMFLLLLVRYSLRSILFPYTTLFRSQTFDLSDDVVVLEDKALTCSFFELHVRALDRKSTCLNSSHVAISYAVFCLKKKKAANHPLHKATKSGAPTPGPRPF